MTIYSVAHLILANPNMIFLLSTQLSWVLSHLQILCLGLSCLEDICSRWNNWRCNTRKAGKGTKCFSEYVSCYWAPEAGTFFFAVLTPLGSRNSWRILFLVSLSAVMLPFSDLLLYNGPNLVWGASIQAYGHDFHCCRFEKETYKLEIRRRHTLAYSIYSSHNLWCW
jgi:hypothetical protein